MKRYLVVFRVHHDAGQQSQECMYIYAKDREQAIQKWIAVKTPNEWMVSIS